MSAILSCLGLNVWIDLLYSTHKIARPGSQIHIEVKKVIGDHHSQYI